MKNVKVGEARVNYQLKNNWRLRAHQMETPRGVSMAVPDDSYTIRDLIKKYASGLDPGITKLSMYGDEDENVDFDDVDLADASRSDIAETTEMQREAAARQKTLLEQMEQRKKALEKKPENRGLLRRSRRRT